MKKQFFASAIVIAVFLLAVVAGLLLFHFYRPRPPAARSTTASTARGAEPPHVRGSADAPVTLEEFGDFECPPCGNLSPYLDEFEKMYRNKLRILFREFPMPVHPHAFRAAEAAEAAGLQRRFWEMNDLLYRERLIWPRVDRPREIVCRLRGKLHLDVDRFKRDIDSAEVKRRIAADQQRAASLQVDRTPTLFVNDRLVPATALSPAGLREAIDAALKQKPR